jgi:ribonucleoside-triphosphate reductase
MNIPTEVYSRVSGYFRPVSQWNKGKKEEFSQRRFFKLNIEGGDNESKTDVDRKTKC